MESNQEEIDEMALLNDSDDFIKTLNRIVPKSEYITEPPKRNKSIAGSIEGESAKKLILNPGIFNEVEKEKTLSSSPNSHTSKKSITKLKPFYQLPKSSSANSVPRQGRLQKIMRQLNNEYIKQVKETDIRMRRKEDLYKEMNLYSKLASDHSKSNRDEDLLKMQRENQEIEVQLKELKNKDKSELKQKEEQSRKLIEDLNNMFNEKKKEALEKDDERKKIIEEIKQIKKDQEDHKNTINKYTEERATLTNTLNKLENDIQNLKDHEKFINEVFENQNQSHNDGFTKLSNKFKELIESMDTIEKDIAEQDQQIKEIKKKQKELVEKNDKQAQNKKLLDLENEIKDYIEKNKNLEKEIEEIQKKNQKKDSDTYQIKLSINNLYMKCKYKESDEKKKQQKEMEGYNTTQSSMGGRNTSIKNVFKDKNDSANHLSDGVLCNQLTEINERIADLIQIYKKLET